MKDHLEALYNVSLFIGTTFTDNAPSYFSINGGCCFALQAHEEIYQRFKLSTNNSHVVREANN